MKTFSHVELRRARELAGLSREDVARALHDQGCDTHADTIANWESGETHPTADLVPLLATIVRVSLFKLYS